MKSEKVKEIKYYLGQSACMYGNMQKQALTLINELESELEKEQINNLNCDTELQYKEKRIAELEKENATKTDTITDLLKKQEFYETEKLKQFAERLKEELKDNVNGANVDHYVECSKFIDKTLKEFISGQKI